MDTLILATSNAGKIKELNALLAPIRCIPQAEAQIQSVAETGQSFIENALLKARHASTHTHLPALADDSGLVVPALNGRPGIYSARFAGNHATDKANNLKLLAEMAGIEHREAYFYCAIALVRYPDDPTPLVVTGLLNGIIHTTLQGSHGFGYDPLFYLPTHQCTMAALADDIKNRISHRATALQQFKNELYCHKPLCE